MTPKVEFDKRKLNGHGTWPAAALELVKRECGIGTSSGQIVKLLRAKLGISKSRNAVIGKVLRMGYARPVTGKASAPERARFDPNAARARKRLEAKAAAPVVRRTPAPFKISGGGHIVKPAPSVPLARGREVFGPWRHVAFLELTDAQCRMPIGDEGDFCGCRCERGARGRFDSYCATHKAVVLDKTPRPPKAPSDDFSVRRYVSHKIGSRFHGF